MDLKPFQARALPGLLDPISRGEPIDIANWDMGTGKTVIACYLMATLKQQFGVMAPKATLESWRRTAAAFDLNPRFIVNPEKLRTNRRIETIERDPANKRVWRWKALRPGEWLILDELHTYGGLGTDWQGSQMSHMAYGAKISDLKVLGLTGTLGDSPLKLRLLLALAGLVPWNQFFPWAREHGCFRNKNLDGMPWMFQKGPKGHAIMEELNQQLFPRFGSRLRIADIPDYPECENQLELVDIDAGLRSKIDELYSSMRVDIRNPNLASTDRVRLLRNRQKVELEKIPVFEDLIREALEEGYSVVASFNFSDPMFALAERFRRERPALVYGTDPLTERLQTERERTEHVDRFQRNETRLCLLMAKAGGVGLNLGDELGGHPRVGFHNVPLDPSTLLQVFGRIHRATDLTKALNKLVLLAGVQFEEGIWKMLKNKIQNLSSLQGDDLDVMSLEKKVA